MEEEREAAERVKREVPILVVLGNPPYNGFAGVAIEEERDLTEAYRTTRKATPPQGQGLNDLYVRFFRMAERRIVEQTGRGVICFISNYSWLDGLSFTGMRERYLDAFDRIWIDCLNGDKYKTGKLTPEGDPDPSIFSTEFNREGIQVGTAIGLLTRGERHEPIQSVLFRHLWGRAKRAELQAEAERGTPGDYSEFAPGVATGLAFVPTATSRAYFDCPRLPDLFPAAFPGVKTSRDDFVVDIDRERLIQRLEQYFDPKVSHEEMRRLAPTALTSTARFNAESTRDLLRKRGFLPQNIVRYCYRPFDLRWIYWEPETKLLDEKRSEYFPNIVDSNVWLEARQRQPKERFDRGFVTKYLADNFGAGLSSFFPLRVASAVDRRLAASGLMQTWKENVSEAAQGYLSRIASTAGTLFYHCVAVLHSPTYRTENSGALRQDWPRIPLPDSNSALEASASLGQEMAVLLDTESPVNGVAAGTIRPELREVGNIQRVGGGALKPSAGELDLTAGWGHAGKEGVAMPGKGKLVERDYAPAEMDAIRRGAEVLGVTVDHALRYLGKATYDVYLNDVAYWRNVPANVWTYTIGGYQVIKKWLSYRESDLLRRGLRPDEAREVTDMARRIAAILLLQPKLDINYQAAKESLYGWGRQEVAGPHRGPRRAR